jgi:hypothetical protein
VQLAVLGATDHSPEVAPRRAYGFALGGDHSDCCCCLVASHSLAGVDPGRSADAKLLAEPVGSLDEVGPAGQKRKDIGLQLGETVRMNFGVTAGSGCCERSGEPGSAEAGESPCALLTFAANPVGPRHRSQAIVAVQRRDLGPGVERDLRGLLDALDEVVGHGGGEAA